MALYANENGTLQQLSDKSSGSNPYVQLELVYSRSFGVNPSTAAEQGKHDFYTNKAIKEYNFILISTGGSVGTSVSNANPYWYRIDEWMESYRQCYHSWNIRFEPSVQSSKPIYISCKGTEKGGTAPNMVAFDNNILEVDFLYESYTGGSISIFMI